MNRRALLLPATLTALLTVGSLTACEFQVDIGEEPTGTEITQARDVSAVTRVELRTAGTLNLAVGDEPGLSVTGKSDVLEDLTTTVEGDTLVIDLKDHSWRRLGYLQYDLVVPALATVVLDGSGGVFGELGADDAVELRIDGSGTMAIDDLSADTVRIAISGSGDVTVGDLAATDVDVVVDGSGEVDLAGRTDTVSVSIPGSGGVDVAELQARAGDVSIGGSGEAVVNAADTLTVEIDGSGDVSYLGDPKVDQRIDGSGDISRR